MGITMSLYNNSFFSRNLFFGKLNVNFGKNGLFVGDQKISSKDVTYRLINGDGDDDNDRFEIIGTNLYSKPQYNQDETKKIYKVLVRAEYLDQSIIEQNFEILGYQSATGYSPIVSIYTKETKFIDGLQISANWFVIWNGLIIDNKPSGQVEITKEGIFYTASDWATDDNVLLKSNNQVFFFDLLFQVFDDNRIQNLAKQIGTFRFKNISYDNVSKNWIFGNFRFVGFYVYNQSYVFGQAGLSEMIIFND